MTMLSVNELQNSMETVQFGFLSLAPVIGNMVTKEVHIVILVTCKDVTLCGERYFTEMTKRILRQGDNPGLILWTELYCNVLFCHIKNQMHNISGYIYIYCFIFIYFIDFIYYTKFYNLQFKTT